MSSHLALVDALGPTFVQYYLVHVPILKSTLHITNTLLGVSKD